MAANAIFHPERESFLLELLHFAGWQLQASSGTSVRVHARRADVDVSVTGATLAEAAGVAFARAMRSGRRNGRGKSG